MKNYRRIYFVSFAVVALITIASFGASFALAVTAGVSNEYPQVLFQTYLRDAYPSIPVDQTSELLFAGLTEFDLVVANTDVEVIVGATGVPASLRLTGEVKQPADAASREPKRGYLTANRNGSSYEVRVFDRAGKKDSDRDEGSFSPFGRLQWGEGARLKLTVTIPIDYRGAIRVRAVSGDLKVKDINLDSLSFESTSGDLDETGSLIQKLRVKTVSGDISLAGRAQSLDLETISGDVEVRVAKIDESKLDWNISAVSGEVKMIVASDAQVEFESNSTSGDIDVKGIDVQANENPGRSETTSRIGDGRHGRVRARTVSGDISTRLTGIEETNETD